MTRPDNCPHCGVSLLGELMTPAQYASGHFGESSRYRREIGNEVQGVFDGVLFWSCPDCGGTWQRFDMTSPLHHVAEQYMHPQSKTWAPAPPPETGEDHDHTRT